LLHFIRQNGTVYCVRNVIWIDMATCVNALTFHVLEVFLLMPLEFKLLLYLSIVSFRFFGAVLLKIKVRVRLIG